MIESHLRVVAQCSARFLPDLNPPPPNVTIRIFGSPEPNVLGLKNFETSQLVVFEGLLRGLSGGEIKAQAAANPAPVGTPPLPVEEIVERVRALPLFKSIIHPPGKDNSIVPGCGPSPPSCSYWKLFAAGLTEFALFRLRWCRTTEPVLTVQNETFSLLAPTRRKWTRPWCWPLEGTSSLLG